MARLAFLIVALTSALGMAKGPARVPDKDIPKVSERQKICHNACMKETAPCVQACMHGQTVDQVCAKRCMEDGGKCFKKCK